ncbi:MAG: acetyl-CoA acetyltransferase [Dehalococcoidia bacterium]
MPEGIKDKVAIIGMGCTKFGELWDKSGEDLMVDAFKECLEDAGIEKNDIDVAFWGACFPMQGLSGMPLSTLLHLPYIGVTHVENLCASGTEALRAATYAVASGASDIAMAIGVEKLKDVGYGGLPAFGVSMTGANYTAPGSFAMLATKYFATYNLSPDEGKRMIGRVSVKSHHNGTLNPKAHLRREVTLDDVIKSPIVAWPLGLYDCCGVSDGSAAAIVVKASEAKKFRPDPVYVKALQIAISSGEEIQYTDFDFAHVESTRRAAVRAYKEAGIKNAREEISMAEVHDCFSITEAVTMEDLQFSPIGHAREDIESGFFDLDGGLPVQPDGGLKCFGHPIGASGLRMVYEMYKQLQGKADARQIKDTKLGLTHNLGGFPQGNVCSVAIVGL